MEIYAHRGHHGPGAYGQRRENTVEAFLDARRLGIDGVELDVWRSRDGVMVVSHDPVVYGARISKSDYANLVGVPTLEAALEACGDLKVNVEVKTEREGTWAEDKMLAELVTSEAARAQVVGAGSIMFSSFDLTWCIAVKAADAKADVRWVTGPLRGLADSLRLVEQVGISGVHPYIWRMREEEVALGHEMGIALVPWAVDSARAMARMALMGITAIITDEPKLALSTYRTDH